MTLPDLIKHFYGQFAFSGLYSFEFVDKNRKSITEIFFMMPPKSKSTQEGTRATINPTFGRNYVTDGGNAVKTINLSGEFWFPHVGSTQNPTSADIASFGEKINGYAEMFKIRYLLIRYRDYTMTRNGQLSPLASGGDAATAAGMPALIKIVEDNMHKKIGTLYDQLRLIFHDYDMDDHFYCKVSNFIIKQTDDKYIVADYDIELECYEVDNRQHSQVVDRKLSLEAEIDASNFLLQNGGKFTLFFENIQNEIQYNVSFFNTCTDIATTLDAINTENTSVQAGQSTVYANMPGLLNKLTSATSKALTDFLTIFLSDAQQADYENGDLTLDDVLVIGLISFYNSMQKIKLTAEGAAGMIEATLKTNTIRFSSNADDYSLTTDQFDSTESVSNIVQDQSSFEYYTVRDGDTARLIALKMLHDESKYISILQINQISESDFIDGTLIGTKIKIPIIDATNQRNDDNIIYDPDDSNILTYLHGVDLALDVNGQLSIDSTGDALAKEGVSNTYDALLTRLNNKKGSLNVFTPNWGLTSIGDDNAPLLVRIDRYITDLTNQIKSDPRVVSVQINTKNLQIDGEVLRVSGKVKFIGSDESRGFEVTA